MNIAAPIRKRLRALSPMALAVILALPHADAFAQSAGEVQLVRDELKALREQQSRIAEMQRRNEAAIRALEARLGVAPAPAGAPEATPAIPAPAAQVATAAGEPERLKITGDVRLRGQYERSDSLARNRTSSQIRARLGATYVINDRLTVGGRLATGDSDDPNSTDVQLSNWNDDLGVSLDLAYAQLDFGDLKVYGGKMPMPFTRTDLVWDGDVNPQGLAATYRHRTAGGGSFQANGLFFLVDEQAVAGDTTMGGAQLGYSSPGHGGFKYDLAGGYYRYSTGGMAGADAGDWRSNRLKPDGTFLSDFRLLDLIAAGTWQGASEKWPLRVTGNYVRNLGAFDDQDSGYGVDVSIGRAGKPGDWRLTYGYSRTDVDAVMTAFSHDNISIGSNYRLHALTAEYTPMPNTSIAAIWYRYAPRDAAFSGGNAADDWIDRFRVYVLMNF